MYEKEQFFQIYENFYRYEKIAEKWKSTSLSFDSPMGRNNFIATRRAPVRRKIWFLRPNANDERENHYT